MKRQTSNIQLSVNDIQLEDFLKEIQKFLTTRFDKIDRNLELLVKVKDALDGDKLLDNQDLCIMLGITKRSLARYRQKKLIRYYQIDGKTYYKASEIQAFLKTKGKLE
jgi:hypothetical protein